MAGVFELVWFCGPVLSNSLVDLLDIGDCERKKMTKRKTRTNLTLTIMF